MNLAFDNTELVKRNNVISKTSSTNELIFYLYVDRDCTVTGTGKTDSTYIKASNINLKLKKGWNAINMVSQTTGGGATAAVKTGDLSSRKWVLTVVK